MTPGEWLVSTDPHQMLACVGGRPRKLRLFACACARRVWHLLSGAERAAVAVAEQFADGAASRGELRAAAEAVSVVPRRWVFFGESAVLRAVQPSTAYDPGDAGPAAESAVEAGADAAFGGKEYLADTYRSVERAAQARLLRDLFGNPFRRPPPAEPSLLTRDGGLVVGLARAAYDDRLLPAGHLDPDRLAVLADALEEAGCVDPGLLGHLRGLGPHIRGCWAVDSVLGYG